ncbi:serine/threonine protein kinase [Streptomyces sp. BE303]|uniref:serine/threonine protein kinase n=1 Tax=Streptomyces sp. BE303 TaxID=3002528 RepID=UPI002E78A5EB|nr:serine/threonine protein kinase [Streptomyces sp. BE303]MED7949311.1 serine/threonine protein kinase [Streptomyces sp. BE303]
MGVTVTGHAVAVAAGVPPISFATHQLRTGGAGGAREDFETMIAELAAATKPGVRMIAANPGDWGVDAFAGNLGGAIAVWQSKYFFPVTAAGHQRTIRESFASVLKAAKAQGHTVEIWVLCIPSSMDGPTTKWWDRWKKQQEKAHELVIELWDETALRVALHTPEGDQVRRAYYEPFTPAPQQEQLRLVLEVEEEEAAALDSALFVRQMAEAGHVELDSAKRQFFNADLVAREIAHKAVPAEIAALSSADATLHGLWEMQFNDCTTEGTLPALHGRVWREVRSEHERLPKVLRLEVVHAWGLVHRLVDNRKAGWVKHWRDIAAQQNA